MYQDGTRDDENLSDAIVTHCPNGGSSYSLQQSYLRSEKAAY